MLWTDNNVGVGGNLAILPLEQRGSVMEAEHAL